MKMNPVSELNTIWHLESDPIYLFGVEFKIKMSTCDWKKTNDKLIAKGKQPFKRFDLSVSLVDTKYPHVNLFWLTTRSFDTEEEMEAGKRDLVSHFADIIEFDFWDLDKDDPNPSEFEWERANGWEREYANYRLEGWEGNVLYEQDGTYRMAFKNLEYHFNPMVNYSFKKGSHEAAQRHVGVFVNKLKEEIRNYARS